MRGEWDVSDKSAPIRVTILTCVCETPGALPLPVYGLRVETANISRQWPDLADNLVRVEELARRLEELCPESCLWEDIIEDFVLERYLP